MGRHLSGYLTEIKGQIVLVLPTKVADQCTCMHTLSNTIILNFLSQSLPKVKSTAVTVEGNTSVEMRDIGQAVKAEAISTT